MASKSLALVILNYNGRALLEEFLPSVCQYSSEADIYLIDNASQDDSRDFLAQAYPQIKLITLSENGGFSRGYNQGLAQIEAKYYVLLNSDVALSPNWLPPLLNLMESDPKIAACQPKIKSYREKEYFEYAGAAGGFMDRLGYPFCRGRIFDEIEKDQGQYEEAGPIFWASGACFMVRAELYWKLGALEEDFFAHMEEIDLCWRMWRAGYEVHYCPQSEVYHLGGGTLASENPRKTFLNFRNNLALMAKNLSGFALFRVLIQRLFWDSIAGLNFIRLAKWSQAWALLKAYFEFYRRFGFWRRKKIFFSCPEGSPPIYFGSLPWAFFFLRKRLFSKLSNISKDIRDPKH